MSDLEKELEVVERNAYIQLDYSRRRLVEKIWATVTALEEMAKLVRGRLNEHPDIHLGNQARLLADWLANQGMVAQELQDRRIAYVSDEKAYTMVLDIIAELEDGRPSDA